MQAKQGEKVEGGKTLQVETKDEENMKVKSLPNSNNSGDLTVIANLI